MLMLLFLTCVTASVRTNNETMVQLMLQNWDDLASNEQFPISGRFEASKRYHQAAHGTSNEDELQDELFWRSLDRIRSFVYDSGAGSLIRLEAAGLYESEVRRYQTIVENRQTAEILANIFQTLLTALRNESLNTDDDEPLNESSFMDTE